VIRDLPLDPATLYSSDTWSWILGSGGVLLTGPDCELGLP